MMARRWEVFGTATTLSALAYFLGLAPTASSSPRTERVASARAVSSVTPSGKQRDSGADLLAKFFGGAPDGGTCARPYSLSISVVILPDPVDSHLDWGFDAGLESVNRAFERQGFVADRFWLPWADAMSAAEGAGSKSDPTRAWIQHPGTLLFRKAKPTERELHLVYIVGDVPTIGLHKDALREALAERDSILGGLPRALPPAQPLKATASTGEVAPRFGDRAEQRVRHATRPPVPEQPTLPRCLYAAPGSTVLRIVGPTFSGSVPSLAIALERWRRPGTAPERSDTVVIVTGSATTDINRDVLSSLPSTRFSASVYPASSLNWFIDSVLVARMNIRHRQIAMLTESSTQFGNLEASAHRDAGYQGADTSLLSIPFPINIAGLRTEYARHPATPPQSEDANTTAAPRVPLSLLDPAHTSERPGLASTQLTVPAADLAIREILRTLSAHRIRAVGIAATDVRDQLFLAGIIKERLRDVQLFMIGSNILFLRPDLNESLLGTLVLSAYPLFLENQFWDPNRVDRSRFMFTSDLAEGIYNATLTQLGAGLRATDYSIPIIGGSMHLPPLWVTTVGRDALYPVTITDASDTSARNYLHDPLRDAATTLGTPLPAPEQVQNSLEFIIIALALMVGAPAAYFVIQRTARPRAPESVVKQLEQMGATDSLKRRVLTELSLMQQRELYVFLRFLPACALALAAALALLRPIAHGDARREGWLLASGLVPLLGIGVLIIGRRTTGRWMWLRSVRGKLTSTEPTAEEQRLAFIDVLGSYLFFGLGAVYIIGFVLYLIDILQLGPNSAALFFQRAVHFGSGVSPLAPLILSALGFIAWAWWHLYRVELLQCRTEFEEACTLECERGGAGADACGLVARYRAGPADEALNEPAVAHADKDQVSPWDLKQFDSRLDRLHDRRPDAGGFAIVVRLIRTRLYHLLPSETATIVLALLLLTLFWLLSQFERSIDAALPGSWLGSHGPIPPFELLLRFAVLGAICAATYALYRFVSVWRLLANLLTRIAESPLCPAFARLPAAIGQLTRLRLFPQASEALINDSIHAKWCALRAAKTLGGAPVVPEFTLQAPPNPRWTSLALQSPNAKRGADFDVLYSSLCHVWRAEGVQPTSQRLAAKATHDTAKGTHDTAKEPRRWASPRQKWMTAAEELVAVYVVDYIECVFKYLRGLAAFLLVALVLMTVLIVAYPFQPASVVRTMYLLIIGVSVVTLVAVLVRMNRDPVLSAIAGTNAGEVTWDARFVLNLVTFGAVPILTLLGSEFPELRGFLFSWVSPALRAFTKT